MTSKKNDLNTAFRRKKDHLKYFLECEVIDDENLFKDIYISNNSLPEINFDEINSEGFFLGKKISFPLIINAITGGIDEAYDINKALAALAKKFNLPIAVGSQTIAIKEPKSRGSFAIVRETFEDGVVIANLSARSELSNIIAAIDMIDADAVQLHLNVPQEIQMLEGDRNFKGVLKNIEFVVPRLEKEVIVKEVGFGISQNVCRQLLDVGVKYIDIGGKGGTNFLQIENLRSEVKSSFDINSWGIPTALSLLECRKNGYAFNLICSGGITKPEEIVKALCTGADIVGISGLILRELLVNGQKSAEVMLEKLIYTTKMIMLLLGKKSIKELREVNYKLTGTLKELIE